MALIDVWTNSQDGDFQGRCMAALWNVCQHIADGDSGYPAASQVDEVEDMRFALKVLREEHVLSMQQLAVQVLRNATIASSPATSDDVDLIYTINAERWAELRGIG